LREVLTELYEPPQGDPELLDGGCGAGRGPKAPENRRHAPGARRRTNLRLLPGGQNRWHQRPLLPGGATCRWLRVLVGLREGERLFPPPPNKERLLPPQ